MSPKAFEPDKKKFKDEKGRYIVQGLFLEDRYNVDLAIYTFDGEDKEYKGVVYPSLKRLYIEEMDPEEYTFANKYLFDWPHWKRLCNNSIISKHIETWREELELKIRSEGIATMVHLAMNEDSYQAAKFLADKGWVKNSRGRPSREELEGELKKRAEIESQYKDEFQLIELHKKGK